MKFHMKRLSVFFISILVSYVFMAMPVYAQNFNFNFNNTMTTNCGPAFADILLEQSNFLPCLGGPIALCYYSGPEPETCVLRPEGDIADCECLEIPYGVYFVDINAILNLDIYIDTIKQCGHDGSDCQVLNSATVCDEINNGTFIQGADVISTFSFDCIPTDGIGSTNCARQEATLYAGCMTAPCTRTEEVGIVKCECPTFNGPFQIGLKDQMCNLNSDSDMVWSAAFNTNNDTCKDTCTSETCTSPILPPDVCIPDAPVDSGGCQLIQDPIPTPPPGIDCGKVCQEYEDSQDERGIELGFTCDATLCTSECNDRDLVGVACTGLQALGLTEIINLEVAAKCSCCASQICGCDANPATEQAIFDLNRRQRNREICPQCDINGTLCGENSNGENSNNGGSSTCAFNGGSSTCALAPAGTQNSFPIYILLLGLVAVRMFMRRRSG
jgi:hypothetical protein